MMLVYVVTASASAIWAAPMIARSPFVTPPLLAAANDGPSASNAAPPASTPAPAAVRPKNSLRFACDLVVLDMCALSFGCGLWTQTDTPQPVARINPRRICRVGDPAGRELRMNGWRGLGRRGRRALLPA